MTESRLPQLRLPFPDTVTSFDDLAITESNRAAVDTIRRPEAWKSPFMCLVGPMQSGLGVTAYLWSRETNARLIEAKALDALSDRELDKLAHAACAIDLADQVSNEDHLLTLMNIIDAKDGRLLLTARSAGVHWACQSPDLKSRLSTMPVAEIYPPDEDMIGARLLSSCRRRYIKLAKPIVEYLIVRLPRSYVAIEDYVERLDREITETGRAPSIHLARSVLEDGVNTQELFQSDEQ